MSNSTVRNAEIINLVMRQTNYTEDEVADKLKYWNNNYIDVIKEYLNPDFKTPKKDVNSKTLNQQMLGEIRTFMDDVYVQSENRKKRKQYINYLNQLNQFNQLKQSNKPSNENTKVSEETETSSENKIKIEEVV